MPIPTRKLILEILEKSPGQSAESIASQLGMTKVNIQYHLKKLVTDQIVDVSSFHNKNSRGRPWLSYQLRIEKRPDNLEELARILLSSIRNSCRNENAYQQQIREWAQILTRNVKIPSGAFARLNNAVKEMNQRHHQARWEARKSGPQIIFHHCPYAKIIGDYPELCQLDALILEYLLRISIFQKSKISLSGVKPHECVFETAPE